VSTKLVTPKNQNPRFGNVLGQIWMFDSQPGHLKIGPEDDVTGLQVKLLVGLSKALSPPNQTKAEACVSAFRSEAAAMARQLRDLRFCSLNEFWSGW
jgi:hypothetical protein